MEQTSYLQIANSIWVWLAAGSAISVVLIQAFLFARRSYSAGLEIGLTRPQMNDAIRSSVITSIGPSLVILSAMIALLVSLGGPMAWMRLSFIGSAMFEMMAASMGMQAVNVTMGQDVVTDVAFANAIWTMTLGSTGWIIIGTLSADKMDKAQKWFSGSDTALMSTVATAAILAAFGVNSSSHLLAWNKNTVSCVAGGATMLILTLIGDSKNIKWLAEWSLFFALLGGITAAILWPF